MASEWKTAHDFCRFLELSPTPTQCELFDRFVHEERHFDARYDNDTMKGMMALLLWHVLSNPGRRAIILGAPNQRNVAMGFVLALLQRKAELFQLCDIGRWSVKFGNDPGWEIRASGTNTANLVGKDNMTVLVLDAGQDWVVEAEERFKAMKESLIIRMF